MNCNVQRITCLAFALALGGCATPTPLLDQTFGDAVRMSRMLQIANPDADCSEDPVAGLDGLAARESIERYKDSFKAPPPATNVINIGGAIGGHN